MKLINLYEIKKHQNVIKNSFILKLVITYFIYVNYKTE